MKPTFRFGPWALCVLGLVTAAFVVAPSGRARTVLNPGDIVVANGGNVVAVNPQNGDVAVVACCFGRAVGVAIDATGNIIVSDRLAASVVRVDPVTGGLTTISSGGLLLQPHGLTLDANGDILVADADTCCGAGTGRIVRIDPTTGAQTPVSSSGSFVDPIGVEVEPDGNLLVADFNARRLFRVDPTSGAQSSLSAFFPNGEPYAAAVSTDGSVFVVDHNDRKVYNVDPTTGSQTLVSSQGLFDQPVDIAVEAAGTLLVSDFTANTIVRVDAITGNQSVVATGLSNPWGMAIVPPAPPTDPTTTNVWLGLKNSDDVGTKFDLQVEILRNGIVVTTGQLNSVPGGSSGFNNAVLRAISAPATAPLPYATGDTLSVRVSVRIAVNVRGHRSGTARLWFGDSAANSGVQTFVNGQMRTYYLLNGSQLGDTVGSGPKGTADVFVDRLVGGNPFKPFGTWTKTF